MFGRRFEFCGFQSSSWEKSATFAAATAYKFMRVRRVSAQKSLCFQKTRLDFGGSFLIVWHRKKPSFADTIRIWRILAGFAFAVLNRKNIRQAAYRFKCPEKTRTENILI